MLGAIPTIVLFSITYIAYRLLVHNPLVRMLASSGATRTQGAIERAQQDIAAAEKKTADYERQLRDARLAIYKSQESRRSKWMDERMAMAQQARAEANKKVEAERGTLRSDVDRAKAEIELNAEVIGRAGGGGGDEDAATGDCGAAGMRSGSAKKSRMTLGKLRWALRMLLLLSLAVSALPRPSYAQSEAAGKAKQASSGEQTAQPSRSEQELSATSNDATPAGQARDAKQESYGQERHLQVFEIRTVVCGHDRARGASGVLGL